MSQTISGADTLFWFVIFLLPGTKSGHFPCDRSHKELQWLYLSTVCL